MEEIIQNILKPGINFSQGSEIAVAALSSNSLGQTARTQCA